MLKTSEVKSAYKKDSKLKCSNNRTISVLANIDKVLERITYNSLYVLEMNSVIYDLQFGFRQKLIYLTDKIREQLGGGNFACEISFDLQKAFETEDHDILLQKLNHCGMLTKLIHPIGYCVNFKNVCRDDH